jgi:hypothetical protein
MRPVCSENVSPENFHPLHRVDQTTTKPAYDGSVENYKKVSVMSCLICAGGAERIHCQGPWEERDCPDCGRYRVADELLLTLIEQGQIFDVGKTRGWLDSRRAEVAIPSIEVHEALLVG